MKARARRAAGASRRRRASYPSTRRRAASPMLRYWALLATAAAQRYEVLEGVELVWAAPATTPTSKPSALPIPINAIPIVADVDQLLPVAMATIALIIISYKELQNHSKLNKKIYYLLIPSVVLLIFGRIILSTNYLDDKIPFKSYFINMNEFSNELDSIAENHPVLFTSKYHYLSIYSFAKNKLIPGSPNYSKRLSQVDLNKIDSIYNGKRIFALNYGNEKIWTSNTHLKLRGSFINNYYGSFYFTFYCKKAYRSSTTNFSRTYSNYRQN